MAEPPPTIFKIAMAEFEDKWHEGFMPVLGCPGCNQDTMEYVEG